MKDSRKLKCIKFITQRVPPQKGQKIPNNTFMEQKETANELKILPTNKKSIIIPNAKLFHVKKAGKPFELRALYRLLF